MKKLKQTKYISGGKNRFFTDEKKRHPLIPILIVLIVLAGLAFFAVKGLRDGHQVVLDRVTVTSAQLPASFDGYRILQISDFYGKEFGDRQSKIRKLLEGEDFDMILLTGDYMGDNDDPEYWYIRDILDNLDRAVPIYYILGDTDYKPSAVTAASEKWKMCIVPPYKTAFMKFIEEEYGATFVYPAQRITNEKGDSIYLTGIEYDRATLNEVDFDPDADFSICVTHKPINYNVSRHLKDVNKRTLTEVDFDLAISGHTGGGQYRLPVLGAVYTEEEGWFPQEDSCRGLSRDGDGRYTYISGGLGLEKGFRFYSHPEIAIIELRSGKDTKQ